jgi:hypothetical protein
MDDQPEFLSAQSPLISNKNKATSGRQSHQIFNPQFSAFSETEITALNHSCGDAMT